MDSVITVPGAIAGAVPGATDGDGTSWPSQSAKRSWLLELARRADADWVLMLDSDEELHNGHLLRGMLERWPFAVRPLVYEHHAGVPMLIGWKCLHVRSWRAFVAQSYYLLGDDAPSSRVTPHMWRHGVEAVAPELATVLRGLAWISHHPERRPAGRRELRLGFHEHNLEPPPPAREFPLPPPLAIPAGPSIIPAIPSA